MKVSEAALENVEVLFLELRRDDGAIVYLNGKEVLRDNLPEGPVNNSTLALRATAGSAESEVFRYIIDKSDLNVGTNVIAVEVHQAAPTSSDLAFDAGLYGSRSTAPVELINFNSNWRYLDDGSDLSAIGWQSGNFDDSAWQEGNGEFGYDSNTEATLLDFGDDPNNKHTTSYFRRKFLVGDKSDIEDLFIHLLYDDGAIIYINGEEAARVNLPADTVTFDTLAPTASRRRHVRRN